MMILFFIVLWAALLVFVVFGFIALFVGPKERGVPFVPTSRKRVKVMLDLAGPLKGKRVADLGSGDGRLVIAFARAGAEGHGDEINPALVQWTRIRIFLAGLQGRAYVHWRNYWRENLSEFGIVTLFGLPPMMQEMEKKLKRELRPGAIVLSNTFEFPTWIAKSQKEDVRIYEKS